MSDIILKAENISKQYRLGLVGTGTISHDLNRWWHKVRGKDDPFLKIGDTNDRSTKAESDYVWALKDINFEVQRGEVLGIIGKNGAGKSTLLKILSRVTSPTTGEIKTKGRIASLLEVGTGFHPEMTGRENIYLNGAILGMTKAEIRSKIDEIIEFSGCERYIDTPVKRYSSGMKVRLAFAVAAHLEPDILVVDEVLAVGDAEFQKKAVGKMQDISKGEGRTVLFVSHNMAVVKSLCSNGMVLDNGEIHFTGEIEDCINYYLKKYSYSGINENCVKKGPKSIFVNKVDFISNNKTIIATGEPLDVVFHLKGNLKLMENNLRLDFKIDDIYKNRIAWFSSLINVVEDNGTNLKENKITFKLKRLPLNVGQYNLSYVLYANQEVQENAQEYLNFDVLEGTFYNNSTINVTPKHSQILLDYEVYR